MIFYVYRFDDVCVCVCVCMNTDFQFLAGFGKNGLTVVFTAMMGKKTKEGRQCCMLTFPLYVYLSF